MRAHLPCRAVLDRLRVLFHQRQKPPTNGVFPSTNYRGKVLYGPKGLRPKTLGEVDGEALEVVQRAVIERFHMGGAQHDAGRGIVLQRLLPARGA